MDLSNNPLGLAPDVSQMSELATLQLDDSELTELPAGLLQLSSLETADLSSNAITRIPSDILELPMEIAESIDLRGNPFSEASLNILIEYFRTHQHRLRRTSGDRAGGTGGVDVRGLRRGKLINRVLAAPTTTRTGCCCAAGCDLRAAWHRRNCGRRWRNAAPRRSRTTGRSG